MGLAAVTMVEIRVVSETPLYDWLRLLERLLRDATGQ